MPEYRRFVAYIYAYQNGSKQKNTGYVKVEVREQSCRIRIQMQTGNRMNTRVFIYGFTRVEDMILGILLGESYGNGNLDIRLSMGIENLGETGYDLEKLHGIWIKDENGNDYISVWDDEGIDVEKFVLELPEKEENTEEMEVEMAVMSPQQEQGAPDSETGLAARWQNFKNHYPQMILFAEGIQCVKIAPKDISFLGEKEWQFGQSPFVRQGFWKYGHLILARQEDGRFLLGVPGVYENAQDYHLARMYGFEQFRKAEHVEEIHLPEGEDPAKFGYWYHLVEG